MLGSITEAEDAVQGGMGPARSPRPGRHR
jgi:hypothetical protein